MTRQRTGAPQKRRRGGKSQAGKMVPTVIRNASPEAPQTLTVPLLKVIRGDRKE